MFWMLKRTVSWMHRLPNFEPWAQNGAIQNVRNPLGREKSVDFCGPFSDSFQMAMDYIPDTQKGQIKKYLCLG